ncbi:MAG: hypothetical protein L6R30_09610 [Thermoanaerobaculia bacterium]|nr:hypothetical protein [Thermoanaerobaculia bacterium]
MTDRQGDVEAAADLLHFVTATRTTRVVKARFASAIERFEGRGVEIEAPIEDDSSEPAIFGTRTLDERTLARVDSAKLLEEAIAPFGFRVGTPALGFLRLETTEKRSDIGFWFKLDPHVPIHSILATGSGGLSVVIHTDRPESVDAAFLSTIGVHAERLGAIASLTSGRLNELGRSIGRARRILVAALPPAVDLAAIGEAYRHADPELVADYAVTRQDRLFEMAAAKILAPTVERIQVLGGHFTGRPVPDGLLLSGEEVAIYDCKSKDSDLYTMAPSDGDQQSRYLAILDRAKDEGLSPRGVMLLVPDVLPAEFDDKINKEPWRQISDRGYQMLMLPAVALARLHLLNASEGRGVDVHFSWRDFWRALWDMQVPNLCTSSVEGSIFGDRGRRLRLLTKEVVEVLFLAGIVDPDKRVGAVATSLDGVDAKDDIGEQIRVPRIVRRFWQKLGERKKGVDASYLQSELGIGLPALTLLASHKKVKVVSVELMGRYGVTNYKVLQKELGVSTPGG